MIKATEIILENDDDRIGRTVRVELTADTSAEVIAIGDDGETVTGLGKNDKLAFGSTCLCVDGSFGILGSSGWKF